MLCLSLEIYFGQRRHVLAIDLFTGDRASDLEIPKGFSTSVYTHEDTARRYSTVFRPTQNFYGTLKSVPQFALLPCSGSAANMGVNSFRPRLLCMQVKLLIVSGQVFSIPLSSQVVHMTKQCSVQGGKWRYCQKEGADTAVTLALLENVFPKATSLPS